MKLTQGSTEKAEGVAAELLQPTPKDDYHICNFMDVLHENLLQF